MQRKFLVLAALFICAPGALQRACADVFGFEAFTHADPLHVATAQSQILIDVTSAAPGQVAFWFENNGPLPSTVTQLYFQDTSAAPVLAGMSRIVSGPGTSFSAR